MALSESLSFPLFAGTSGAVSPPHCICVRGLLHLCWKKGPSKIWRWKQCQDPTLILKTTQLPQTLSTDSLKIPWYVIRTGRLCVGRYVLLIKHVSSRKSPKCSIKHSQNDQFSQYLIKRPIPFSAVVWVTILNGDARASSEAREINGNWFFINRETRNSVTSPHGSYHNIKLHWSAPRSNPTADSESTITPSRAAHFFQP